MEYLSINFAGKARREKLHGREYLVAPLTMIVPGVLNGSQGALLYTPNEIKKTASAWNGIPLTVGHPTRNGQQMSGRDPAILNETGIGHVYRINTKKGKLQGEGWFDVEVVKKVDNRIYEALLNGRKIELSTGLFTENHPASRGASFNGKPYTHIARNYRPDHLAILPDQVGACSVNDGCGVNVNADSMADKYAKLTGATALKSEMLDDGLHHHFVSEDPKAAAQKAAKELGKGAKVSDEAGIWSIMMMMGKEEHMFHFMPKKLLVSANADMSEQSAPATECKCGGTCEKCAADSKIAPSGNEEVVETPDTTNQAKQVIWQEFGKLVGIIPTDNAFCPTGPGGGQDNSCGGKGGSSGTAKGRKTDKGGDRESREDYEKSPHKAELRVLGESLDLYGEAMTNGARSALTKAEKAFKSGNKTMGQKFLNSSKRELKRGIKGWSKDPVMVKAMTDILDQLEGLSNNAFCPTGAGGGQDNSCSSKGGGSSNGPTKIGKMALLGAGQQFDNAKDDDHTQFYKYPHKAESFAKAVAEKGYSVSIKHTFKNSEVRVHGVEEAARAGLKELGTAHGRIKSMWETPYKHGETKNAFCPTGAGGGQDNSCGRGEGGGTSAGAEGNTGLNSDGSKIKSPFPKITGKSGGYTARIGFNDEGRGERHFDSSWSIWSASKPGEFTIGNKMAYGDRYSDTTAKQGLGSDLKVGDQITVSATKWTPTRRSDANPMSVKVTGITHKDNGAIHVKYENIKSGKPAKPKVTKNSSVGNRSHSARRRRSGTKPLGVWNMKRDDVIDSLVTNCDCFDEEDRDTLNSLDDKKLKRLHHQLVDNALYEDDEEEVEEEEMMDEEEMPMKKKKPGGFFQKNRKTNNRRSSNDDLADEIIRNRRKPQTADEWFATAPPEIQSAVRNAMTLEQQSKKALLDQLTANVADDRIQQVLNQLKGKSINELQDLLALLPPARAIAAPSFIGAAVPGPNYVGNERALDKDDDDTLPIPTINYAQEYAERAKSRKVS